jgi:hypothetical protein
MIVAGKYLLLAVLIGAGLWVLTTAVQSGLRITVPVAGGEILPRRAGAWQVWTRTLGLTITGLALLGAAWLIWRTSWGVEVVWSDGAWKPAPVAAEVAAETAAVDLEVREPRESWIANLFYGCVMGLSFGLPMLFVKGDWTAGRAFWAVVGLGFFLWMVQSAVLHYGLTMRLSRAGLEERSFFGTRRVPWEELGELEFQNVAQQLENLKSWQDRRRTSIRPIEVWLVKDREGRDIFRLSSEMKPADTFQAMRERIQQRAPGR